jgi:hypothetical protein
LIPEKVFLPYLAPNRPRELILGAVVYESFLLPAKYPPILRLLSLLKFLSKPPEFLLLFVLGCKSLI